MSARLLSTSKYDALPLLVVLLVAAAFLAVSIFLTGIFAFLAAISAFTFAT